MKKKPTHKKPKPHAYIQPLALRGQLVVTPPLAATDTKPRPTRDPYERPYEPNPFTQRQLPPPPQIAPEQGALDAAVGHLWALVAQVVHQPAAYHPAKGTAGVGLPRVTNPSPGLPRVTNPAPGLPRWRQRDVFGPNPYIGKK